MEWKGVKIRFAGTQQHKEDGSLRLVTVTVSPPKPTHKDKD